MQMLPTCEPVDALTAVNWRLINSAVPADELDDAVKDMAHQILRSSNNTIALGKDVHNAQTDMSEDARYAVATPDMAANAANDDAQEGMGALLEQREPQWSDR